MPAADELRRIPVTKPETLATVDPGLATVTPEQLSLPAEPAQENAAAHEASPAAAPQPAKAPEADASGETGGEQGRTPQT